MARPGLRTGRGSSGELGPGVRWDPAPRLHPEVTHASLLQARPGQEAGWSPVGGALSHLELLKRANREVKIGNRNKMAPASAGCV